jgi:hypothetical protein
MAGVIVQPDITTTANRAQIIALAAIACRRSTRSGF